MVNPECAEPGERGQALVVMVFAVIALLVALGLAIDGGMIILDRRRMQNASDAGALAGTRLLARAICNDEADDAAIVAEVNRYAERNGVPDTDGQLGNGINDNVVADYVNFDEVVLGRVGAGAIPNGTTGVSVTARINRPTYFVSLIGIDTAGASAAALAMTGPPSYGSGVRPFGVPEKVVADLSEGDCFDISFGNCDRDECNVNYTGGQTQHRGWMNLDYVWNTPEYPDGFPRAKSSNPGGQLKDWMKDGWRGTLYADCIGWWTEHPCHNGDFVHAKPGTEQDVINVAPIGELIYVPVYDAFPDCDGHAPDIPWPYPTSPNACTGMQGADYYHIIGFAAVEVAGTSTPNHSINLCLEETIWGQGQPSSSGGYGSGACATHTMALTLWK
jgi:Flp pilus assembly protein TadG